ncbi:hypothetical protein Tco_0847535 [Tanacetum coccineum]
MSNTNTNLQTQTSSVLHNDTVSSCSTSKVQEKTQLSKERCMKSLKAIQSQFKFLTDTLQDFSTMPIFKRTFAQDLDLLEQHLTKEIISQTNFLSKEDLKGTHIEHGFNRAFMSLSGQDADTFTSTMLLNVDQLQKQLDKDEFQEKRIHGSLLGGKQPVLEVKHFRDTLLQHMGNVKKFVAERTRQQRQYDRRVNKRQMQTQESKINMGKAVDDDLVITESSGTESEVQDESSMSGNDTNAEDADIRPIYDEKPMAEVQLTAECNIFAIGQQHTEQPEIINEGRVDQYPEQCQVKSPMLDLSPDNQTTEYSKQSLESENILLKKIVA